MRRRRFPVRLLSIMLAMVFSGFAFTTRIAEGQSQPITSPETFFGFRMGADRKLARWDKLVEYYKLLERQSPRIKVVEMGPTTMGNPFLALYISSPANLAQLEKLKQINARLSDPRGASESEIRQLVAGGKAVIAQSMGLHSSEVASSQMAAELIYDLAQRSDEETIRILDNTVAIMIPCFNPDGEILIADWYNKYVGTEFEGVNLPVLYHKYVGHDNNRDAFQTNMVESQYAAKILFRDWIPQAYIDHHQMGPYGARIYIPPYAEPIRPHGDPLVWREMSWYGAHIAYKEEEAGLSGVVNAAIYSGWGHFGFHWITPFHNIAGMLTESASARLGSPLFLHPDQLQGGSRGLPEYEAQTTFPNPWPGGWWRMRDIVDRQKVSAWAALDLASRNRETALWNAYLKARRQTERGAAGKPAAYVIPAAQHDPLTAVKLVNKLLVQGIEVQQARTEFTHEGKVYGSGSYVVSLAQPKLGVIRNLLGRTLYPDNSYTRDKDGNPIRPYDMATDTMAEFMGVRVEPVDAPVGAEMGRVTAPIELAGRIEKGASGYIIDGRLNDSFRAVNLLLDKGGAIRRVSQASAAGLRQGDFVVSGGADAVVQDVARQTGVAFSPLAIDVTRTSYQLKRLRIGMYQRYYGGNMDEGWTRWLIEQWGFPYKSLMDAEIKAGNLLSKYDVIILPADRVEMMTGERRAEGAGRGAGNRPAEYPPEYRSGFGQEGVAALRAFVEKGGTLVTFAEAGDFAIQKFELPLRNVVANRPSKEFWSPGSTLRVRIDNTNPLAYGMPTEGLAVFLANNQAYEVLPTSYNERVERIVTFAERDILQSGWLLGEDALARKAAMVSVEVGQGKVALIGFRAQHRAQTHGTFKLVFNALLSGPDSRGTQ
ncbi:MAG TPA: M14 metallopeptidase family protein [Blastocatellia bacterium]|nr:M14 metallopeptidase family protein [Blastocatellia bacterium]